LGRNKEFHNTVPPLCTLYRKLLVGIQQQPPEFSPLSLGKKRKDPSSCERRFFALDIPSSYFTIFFFQGCTSLEHYSAKISEIENPLVEKILKF
jgi:hypothetical protein